MRYLLLLGLCLTSGLTWAQEDDSSPETWTPEDIINTEFMREVKISPNEQMVVWTKRKGVQEKDKFVRDIYLTRLDVKKDGDFLTIPLTNADENDYSPLFSRNSEKVYFLSSRDEGKKLWSLSIYGGEPEEIQTFENGISNLQWLNDSTLAYTSHDGKTLYEQKLKEEKDNTVVVEDSIHWTTTRVYAFNVKDKSIRRLTDNDYPVSQYAVSRDGRWLITGLRMSPHYPADAQPKSKYYLYDLENDNRVEILQGLQTPGNFQFAHDHQGFYFLAVTSSNPEWNGAGISELYHYNLDNNSYQKIALNWDWGLGGDYAVTSAGVLTHLANGATRTLAFYKEEDDSWFQQMIDLEGKEEHLSFFEVSEDGQKIVFDHSTSNQLPTYYVADLMLKRGNLAFGQQQELSKLNKSLQKKERTRYEILGWLGYQNEEVNGILYYPSDYEEGKQYPLVLSIHGGPSGVDLDLWRERWSTYPHIMAQRGAFVLKPNYHGSSNHGLAFVESIKKNYYDPELEDIIKGVQLLIDRGMVDEDQLGVMGWSNGAILTTMLTVRYPDMFKAAAPGAGDVNWTSDYGTCRFGVSFDQSYFGGAPWDDSNGNFFNENYITKSPLFELEKVKTPTIIFHGSEDRAVPRDQGWEYYRALQQVDEAPVRFLWFPDQPHGLQKITHQLRKMKEELTWFDKYLFETYEAENEAFKKDSPLAMLLKKKESAKTNDGHYGRMLNGILIPEVVALSEDSILLGRYEVTNAQYQAYKPDHQFSVLVANHPVYGVNAEDANGYVTWLSEQTGESYRLPNANEAEKWHKMAIQKANEENTLNYWAGFQITPQEVATLQEKVKEAGAQMIKAVGSHPPIKVENAEVYDLGGNVREYYQGRRAYGFSAYSYADAQADPDHAPDQFSGIRVVKE